MKSKAMKKLNILFKTNMKIRKFVIFQEIKTRKENINNIIWFSQKQ